MTGWWRQPPNPQRGNSDSYPLINRMSEALPPLGVRGLIIRSAAPQPGQGQQL